MKGSADDSCTAPRPDAPRSTTSPSAPASRRRWFRWCCRIPTGSARSAARRSGRPSRSWDTGPAGRRPRSPAAGPKASGWSLTTTGTSGSLTCCGAWNPRSRRTATRSPWRTPGRARTASRKRRTGCWPCTWTGLVIAAEPSESMLAGTGVPTVVAGLAERGARRGRPHHQRRRRRRRHGRGPPAGPRPHAGSATFRVRRRGRPPAGRLRGPASRQAGVEVRIAGGPGAPPRRTATPPRAGCWTTIPTRQPFSRPTTPWPWAPSPPSRPAACPSRRTSP